MLYTPPFLIAYITFFFRTVLLSLHFVVPSIKFRQFRSRRGFLYQKVHFPHYCGGSGVGRQLSIYNLQSTIYKYQMATFDLAKIKPSGLQYVFFATCFVINPILNYSYVCVFFSSGIMYTSCLVLRQLSLVSLCKYMKRFCLSGRADVIQMVQSIL